MAYLLVLSLNSKRGYPRSSKGVFDRLLEWISDSPSIHPTKGTIIGVEGSFSSCLPPMNNLSCLIERRYLVAASTVILGTILAYIASKSPSRRARKQGAKLPPGPERAYLIGNLKNFPKTRWYEHFSEWQKEYGGFSCRKLLRTEVMVEILTGDIIYANIAGTSIVVLNSLEAVDELLTRRTNLYSSRPYKTMTNELYVPLLV